VRGAINLTDEEQVIIDHKFSDFQVHPQIVKNIEFLKFVEPTPIQDKTLEHGLAGTDIIGLADTGTGKTLAFVLPIINKIMADPNQTALIMAPTRELAVQIREEIRQLAASMPIYSALLIGGSDIRRQIMELKRRPHIFIGTPGRIKDLYQRNVLHFNSTKTVVLDEVDRMLDMGFVKDITEIMSLLPEAKQTLLFSATLDNRIESIAMNFMKSPIKISVKTGATAQNVEQNVIKASGKANKINTLKDLLRKDEFQKVIVFMRTKHSAEEVARELFDSGFKAASIHGNKSQSQRESALRKFRNNEMNVLVATDVAARGIDVKDISHVINFDQPATHEDYIHRIGRTGRAGKKGFALTFVD
jgi:superfamily II DNA/RNA helicase